MLHNFESDDTRFGLGRLLETSDYVAENNATGGGGDYVPYEDVTNSYPSTDSTNEVPVSAIRTLSDVSPAMLPALQFATGTASCTDCTTPASDPAPAAAATAAATAAAVVTPMPSAPTTVNWLLIAMGLGLGYALLKSGPASGLGCAPEPAPVPTVQENLGRPPRKPKAGHKHVDKLEI